VQDYHRYNALYYEEVPFSLERIAAYIMAAVALVMLLSWTYQTGGSSIGSEELPALVYFGISLFFIILTALLFTLSKIIIAIHEDRINVSVGIFKFNTLFSNISEVTTDEHSSLKYGGWGIRACLHKEGWVLAYTTFKYKRVSLKLKEGKYKGFVFSTADSQQIIDTLKRFVQ
jgi:hypothetical protein